MKTSEIKPFLSETVIADVMQSIQSNSTRLITTYTDDLHATLEQRRCALGGMLELARALDTWRLVRVLDAHKDAHSRQIEAL
jgi:hypothetical protein